MMTTVHRAATIGDLVVAVFDEAVSMCTDPRDVSRLATAAVVRILLRPHRADTDKNPVIAVATGPNETSRTATVTHPREDAIAALFARPGA